MRRARLTDLYHWLLSMPIGWFLALLAGAFLIANAIFALGYLAAGPDALEGVTASDLPGRFSEAFFFSVQTLDTIGYGKIAPHGFVANSVVTLEAISGLMGLALATGLLFARFSRPTARVLFSKVAIIGNHDGVPSLLFRVANRRLNQIVEANVNVSLARLEKTVEGQVFRTFTDLKLERGHTPIFALSWTIVHPITPDSPLYQATPESLESGESEIVVSLSGIDDVFSQTIHARTSYRHQEIVWNKAFVDMVHRDGSTVHVELAKIHEVVELGQA